MPTTSEDRQQMLAELAVLQSDTHNLEKRLKSKAYQDKHYHEVIGEIQRRLDTLKYLSDYPG